MKSKTIGIVGGALIIVASLLVGTGFEFSSDNLDNNMLLVLCLAGIGVVVFLLMGNVSLASFSAIAATTIAVIMALDILRNSGVDFSVQIVLVVIGVILALIATLGKKR